MIRMACARLRFAVERVAHIVLCFLTLLKATIQVLTKDFYYVKVHLSKASISGELEQFPFSKRTV